MPAAWVLMGAPNKPITTINQVPQRLIEERRACTAISVITFWFGLWADIGLILGSGVRLACPISADFQILSSNVIIKSFRIHCSVSVGQISGGYGKRIRCPPTAPRIDWMLLSGVIIASRRLA